MKQNFAAMILGKTYFSRREPEPCNSNPPANPVFRFPAGLLDSRVFFM
jgi:hypothetical protein